MLRQTDSEVSAPSHSAVTPTFSPQNAHPPPSSSGSEGDAASQLFYVRPRYGEAIWDAQRAHKLKYMLESAVQRRFPKGVKLHVQATDQRALLDLFQQLSMAGFWITRAEVRRGGRG